MGPSPAEPVADQATAAPLTPLVHPQVSPPLPPLDLLAHKYRPTTIDSMGCHREQAKRLRQWILEFINAPKNDDRHAPSSGHSSSDSDYEDDGAMSDDSGAEVDTARKCILLTGPPGIGKTSLVYVVASELKMHIVESHPSEKRDFRLFKTLKLANQKGKINPIARLFQMTQMKQQQQVTHSANQRQKKNPKRKRRKLEEPSNGATDLPKSQGLSLSGDSSILLFEDVDVVFDEDGPFLKSLAEFIRDSKRPVIVTATRFIEHIKNNLVHFQHIQLNKPQLDDCAKILRDVCKREDYKKLDKVTNCKLIAKKLNCDIRQCLNRIHFYGDHAFSNIDSDTSEVENVTPNFCRLSEILGQMRGPTLEASSSKEEDQGDEKEDLKDSNLDVDDETTIIDTPLAYQLEDKLSSRTLACYDTAALIDLMDSSFDFVGRNTLLTRWLDGKPSDRYGAHSCEHTLGEQIRISIVELTQGIYRKELAPVDSHQTTSTTTPRSPVCFNDLKASLGTEQAPLPIASRLRLRPRNVARRGVASPLRTDTVEIFSGY